MAKKPMTHIVVAGSAEVEYATVAELLSDFLLIDTDDEKDFRFYLPADSDYTTEAVEHTADWLREMKESFTALKGIPTASARKLLRKADDVIEPENELADGLIAVLKDAIEEGDEAYLILAWGPQDDAPDGETGDLLEIASDAGVPVKDLTAGLDDLGFEDESESAEEDEPETEEDEAPAQEEDKPTKELVEEEVELVGEPAEGSSKNVTEQADAVVDGFPQLVPDEAQAAPPVEVPDLKTVLAFVYQKLDFEDRANAANQMQPHYSRPLTRAVKHHLSLLLAEEAPAAETSETPEPKKSAQKSPESVQEPLPEPDEEKPKPRRGKARDVDSDVVKVLINEKDMTIRLSPGRGRPKKGEEAHEMTRAEYQALLDSGEYTPF